VDPLGLGALQRAAFEGVTMSDENCSATTSVNLALLRGVIIAVPTQRTLPNGAVAVGVDLATTLATGRVTIPLSWIDPPLHMLTRLQPGREVVVTGTVRRRFYRAGGATQSRTEVVVDQLVPATSTKSVHPLVDGAVERLRSSFGSPGR
jgi:single-strand DNA-binding protein